MGLISLLCRMMTGCGCGETDVRSPASASSSASRSRKPDDQGPSPARSQVGGTRVVSGDEAEPGTPGSGENLCRACHGTGRLEGKDCPICGGTGKIVEGIGGG
jgi:DnaJ-class molecular chaperone